MAEAKKTAKATVKKPVAAAAVKETKAAAVKETKAAAVKEPAVKKPAAKKTTTRTAAAKKAAAVETNISIQFAGKEYTTEQLVKIAKDVWEFDLGKAPADFKKVQLYVKPEEAKAYYVINETETGSFNI